MTIAEQINYRSCILCKHTLDFTFYTHDGFKENTCKYCLSEEEKVSCTKEEAIECLTEEYKEQKKKEKIARRLEIHNFIKDKRDQDLKNKIERRNNPDFKDEFKEWVVNFKGGKCEMCGYSENIHNLNFHHVFPQLKKKNIANFRNPSSFTSSKLLLEELDKCILTCYPCHTKIHRLPSMRIKAEQYFLRKII